MGRGVELSGLIQRFKGRTRKFDFAADLKSGEHTERVRLGA
jgi:hypothetical protein